LNAKNATRSRAKKLHSSTHTGARIGSSVTLVALPCQKNATRSRAKELHSSTHAGARIGSSVTLARAKELHSSTHAGARIGSSVTLVVPPTGFEPVQYFYRGILSPLCLPISPRRLMSFYFIMNKRENQVQSDKFLG
jgi:hypothetical protein